MALIWIVSLSYQDFKFEKGKAEEVQVIGVPVGAKIVTVPSNEVTHFNVDKNGKIKVYGKSTQEQLIELRARLNEIERKAFEKEKSK